MNVILSGRPIQYPLTGIGWYTQYLLQGLQIHKLINQIVCIPNLSDKKINKKYFFLQLTFKKIIKLLPGSYEILRYYRNVVFKRKTRPMIDKGFIYHEPCYILRPYLGPKICTVHDLSHIHYPEYHPKERVKFLLYHLPRSINSADHIITGSQFIRDEIINVFKISPDKITSIYHGISKVFRPRQFNEVKSVLARYGLWKKTYLLSVGTLEPRKNLERLIQAFKQLSEQQRKRYPLVLVGVKGWGIYRLEKLIQPLLQKEQLYYLGYVAETDLPYLYSGAYAFVYISLYEGFGLPLLEAMASGVPALASNVSSMPEVVQNAALLVNPLDVDAISDKLRLLLMDNALRSHLSAQSLIQASKFSWEKCIDSTVNLYQKALAAYS